MSQNNRCNTLLDLREEDNLSIVDEMAGPKVSFIQRFHCIIIIISTLTSLEKWHVELMVVLVLHLAMRDYTAAHVQVPQGSTEYTSHHSRSY